MNQTPPSISETSASVDVAALAMNILEYRFLQSAIRHDPAAKAISFVITSEESTTWSFNPQSPGRLFAPKDLPTAELRIYCTPEMLLRLVTDPTFRVLPSDKFRWAGNIDLLAPLAKNLAPELNPIALRIRAEQEGTKR